jgi:hypothetical protein
MVWHLQLDGFLNIFGNMVMASWRITAREGTYATQGSSLHVKFVATAVLLILDVGRALALSFSVNNRLGHLYFKVFIRATDMCHQIDPAVQQLFRL